MDRDREAMKTAIVSDIHGNLAALEAVLADIEQVGVDRIVSLGDVIGYGPMPNAVHCLIPRDLMLLLSRRSFGRVSNLRHRKTGPSLQDAVWNTSARCHASFKKNADSLFTDHQGVPQMNMCSRRMSKIRRRWRSCSRYFREFAFKAIPTCRVCFLLTIDS